MPNRIDQYLDGLIERADLPPGDRAGADVVKRVIEDTRDFVVAVPAPDLTGDVMRRVKHLRMRPVRREPSLLAHWAERLWRKRCVSFGFRPAYGLLATAAVLVLAASLPFEWRPSVENHASGTAVAAAPSIFVQFRLQAPEALTVRLAGSFTNWQPQYELRQTTPGLWTVILALPLGVHDYAFVVDGERWVADPYASSVADGFGGTSSRLALLPPEDSQL